MTSNNQNFEIFIQSGSIQKSVRQIANSIDRDYVGKNPLLIAVLNGAFMFAADLMKNLQINAEISFIKITSYDGMQQGEVNEKMGLGDHIDGRHVLIVEDIIDSGKTLTYILEKMEGLSPASVNVAALLHKSGGSKLRKGLKYVGFEIPDKFVVGYGLDYNGWGRNFNDIYKITED